MVLYTTAYMFIGDFERGVILTPANMWWCRDCCDRLVWTGPSTEELIARNLAARFAA